jgi:hypothetical protein
MQWSTVVAAGSALALASGLNINRQAHEIVWNDVETRRWDVTVNNKSRALVLYSGERILDAAFRMCDGAGFDLANFDDAQARDNCVMNVFSTLGPILDIPFNKSELYLGPVLYNTTGKGNLADFDYTSTGGIAKIHIGIELALHVHKGGDDLEAAEDATIMVPPWEDADQASGYAVNAYSLWKASDKHLLKSRIELEQMRKCTPVDTRLHGGKYRSQGGLEPLFTHGPPVVSFDEFYPRFFKIHWPTLMFDWNRVKVNGNFRPGYDGKVCVRIDLNTGHVDGPGALERAKREQPEFERLPGDYTTCFEQETDIQVSGAAKVDPNMVHKLTVFLQDNDGKVLKSPLGRGSPSEWSEFTFNPKLLPQVTVEGARRIKGEVTHVQVRPVAPPPRTLMFLPYSRTPSLIRS